MLAHAGAGEPAAALAAYERLRQILAEELGTDPSTETQTIHLAILRGDPVGGLAILHGDPVGGLANLRGGPGGGQPGARRFRFGYAPPPGG
jgi:Bacterial transcriptional activator domain